MKHLTATFEIENEAQEYMLRVKLEGMNAKYVNTLPNTDHLKDDKFYKEYVKAKRDLQLKMDRYVNKKR
jgi:hypothetical protein